MAVKEAARDRFGLVLTALAKEDKRVVALDCDLGRSTRSYRITEVDKTRFIEAGIAEQNMVSTAAGLAHEGKVPFVNSFAVFLTGRAFDQIRQQVSLARLNVKICGSSAGVTQGPDGATHQSIADVALMRSLPGMTVIVPADGPQTEAAVRFAHAHEGPVYLRLSRYEIEGIFEDPYPYDILRIVEMVRGSGVCLLACGPVLKNAEKAARLLVAEGFNPGLASIPTVKPLATEALSRLAMRYKLLVTVEEHTIIGGLAGAVSEFLAGFRGGGKASLYPLGLRDRYGESGKPEELLMAHGLDPDGIAAAVREEYGKLA